MSAYELRPPTMPIPNHPGGPTPITAAELLASRWRRFFALLLDWLIVYGAPIALTIVALIMIDGSDMTATEKEDTGFGVAVLLLGGATLVYQFLYLPLLLARDGRRNGQTLGKQALGVRVVTAEGYPVTYGRALRRELLGTALIAYVIGLYFFVDYAFGLFSNRRQCLHDKIGATYVLREEIPFGDGRPPLPQNLPAPYVPAAPPYGQQPVPPYGQQPAPPFSQQPVAPYGQQPVAPYGQQSAPPAPAPAAPPTPQPAPPFGSYPSTLYDAPQEEPAEEPLYPRAADADDPPEQPATPQPPRPQSPLTARAEAPQQSWSPPRRRDGDGNDEARRAFGDDG